MKDGQNEEIIVISLDEYVDILNTFVSDTNFKTTHIYKTILAIITRLKSESKIESELADTLTNTLDNINPITVPEFKEYITAVVEQKQKQVLKQKQVEKKIIPWKGGKSLRKKIKKKNKITKKKIKRGGVKPVRGYVGSFTYDSVYIPFSNFLDNKLTTIHKMNEFTAMILAGTICLLLKSVTYVITNMIDMTINMIDDTITDIVEIDEAAFEKMEKRLYYINDFEKILNDPKFKGNNIVLKAIKDKITKLKRENYNDAYGYNPENIGKSPFDVPNTFNIKNDDEKQIKNAP